MAKLFANLDRLQESVSPNIVSAAQSIDRDIQSQIARTQFANNISLADRLDQPKLRTTNHLPEFFLSDNYTGFLRIKPFGVYEHKSLTVIKQPTTTTQQGGTTVKEINTTPFQGGTNPTQPVLSILTRQGVVESNNTQTSLITVATPTAIVNQGDIAIQEITTVPNQGAIEITKLNPTINQGTVDIINLNPTINQGVGVTPLPPAVSVGSLQGILATNATSIVVVPAKGENEYLTFAETVDVKKIKIGSGKALQQRESKKIEAAPTPQILVYELDRLLARTTPAIKHGITTQETLTIKIGENDVFNPSLAPTQAYLDGAGKNDRKRRDERLSFISDVLDSDVQSQAENPTLRTLMGDKYPLGDRTTKLDAANDDNVKQFDPTGVNIDIEKSYGQNGYTKDKASEIITRLGSSKAQQDEETNSILDTYIRVPKPKRVDKNGNTLANWAITTYKDGVAEQTTIGEGEKEYTKLVAKIKEQQSVKTQYTGKEQLITFGRLDLGLSLSFSAFITSLSDSTTPNYQEEKALGIINPIKRYTGVVRAISLAFKVVAMSDGKTSDNTTTIADNFAKSKNNAIKTAKKINNLIVLLGIATADQGVVTSPEIEVTVPGLYTKLLVRANSIKIDVPIADTSWGYDDNGSPLPMYYDVSMDFTPIATQGDAPSGFFGVNKTYIGR